MSRGRAGAVRRGARSPLRHPGNRGGPGRAGGVSSARPRAEADGGDALPAGRGRSRAQRPRRPPLSARAGRPAASDRGRRGRSLREAEGRKGKAAAPQPEEGPSRSPSPVGREGAAGRSRQAGRE